MSSRSDHPTVKRFWEKAKATPVVKPDSTILDAQWLRQLCLDAGADDVGFVDIDRPELGNERTDIVRFFQPTKALISFILRMNREPIRSPARSAANVEFHQTGEGVNEVAHHIVTALGNRGVRAINPAMGFPMEVDRVGNSLNRLRSISAFLAGLRLTFQRGQSKGIAATYHFTFTGDEDRKATVVIRDETVVVKEGHVGNADLEVTADSRTWLAFLAKERNLGSDSEKDSSERITAIIAGLWQVLSFMN